VRTTGCGLRCSWCDTPDAFYDGEPLSFDAIISRIEEQGINLVEVTGGEPMEQKSIHEFLKLLVEKGFEVLLETGGHVSLEEVPGEVTRIIDVKCPGSGMQKRNLAQNLKNTRAKDEFKFVLLHREDFNWACETIRNFDLNPEQILFSPVHGEMDALKLAQWILEEKLGVRFQIQLHKYLWGADARGV
jgi:7-carboxy-7-deazaguanine synthase